MFNDSYQLIQKTKAVMKKEGPKNFLAAPKMMYLFTAGSCEKDTIFGAARNCFGPSYFVTALAVLRIYWSCFLIS